MEMTLWTIVVYIQSDSPGGGTDPGTESDIYDCLINTVCLVCGARYMQRSGVRPSVCPSVRLSVCPIDRPQQWLAAGLLLGSRRAGDIDRQPQHGAAAASADSVTFTAAAAC